jgi:acetylornithine deacetylase/succinyl-diaminopimelate desuccinylase-like protein
VQKKSGRPGVDTAAMSKTVHELWDAEILPSLSGLVEIPAVSEAFDPDWRASGHLAAAVEHVRNWLVTRLGQTGARVEVVELDGRSPVLLVDVPASPGVDAGTVLLYGHLDKQPPVADWAPGLGPWTPVVRDGRLYGRGAADDGYAGYAAAAAIEGVLAGGGAHGRCVLLLETGEESGSPDLPAYLEHLRSRLDDVSLVVCLDSGAQDYRRMWLTTSLRGMAQVTVTAKVLDVGQHSGMAGGIVPSSFRVLRLLLDRLEDAETGEVLLPEMRVEIPASRVAATRAGVESAPGTVHGAFPLASGVRLSDDEVELMLNGTWRPSLSVIGADGLPAPEDAGNVLRSSTTLALSFRLPPTADARSALDAASKALSADVPYGAQVELSRLECADGWAAPETAPWLESALDSASTEFFGQPWRTMGVGGSIPFMGLLQEAYPRAQFVVTGVLGPGSNAHVPDESIDLAYAAKVTESVGLILDAHARAGG